MVLAGLVVVVAGISFLIVHGYPEQRYRLPSCLEDWHFVVSESHLWKTRHRFGCVPWNIFDSIPSQRIFKTGELDVVTAWSCSAAYVIFV